MRRLVSVALMLTVTLLLGPLPVALAQGQNVTQPTQGTLTGKALDSNGNVVPPDTRVQLVDAKGNIVDSMPVGADGSFSFSGIDPGNYTIQLVNANGVMFGASSAVTVAAGTSTAVTVTATAAAVAGAATAMSTTALIALLGGGAAAIAATVALVNGDDDSPSR